MKKSGRWISVFTSALLLTLSVFLSSCGDWLEGDPSYGGMQEEVPADGTAVDGIPDASFGSEAESAENGSGEEAAGPGSGRESDIIIPEESAEGSEQTAEETLSPEKVEEIVHSFEEDVFVPDIVFSGSPYIILNDNIPFFAKENLPTESFEYYSDLDDLGRCGIACANIGQDIMPVEERGNIGQIKPSGWHTIKYDIIDGIYLYNRCHLIAYELSGENANEKNLITGTRYMNIDGMLPFENMVADYVKESGNHVLYRVAPLFAEENDLLACGVIMEGWSVEDGGEGICYNVFIYNVQPGIVIDYATGESCLADTGSAPDTTYILNTNTKKFHYPDCSSLKQMAEKNKQEYTGSREEVISMGYDACKRCRP